MRITLGLTRGRTQGLAPTINIIGHSLVGARYIYILMSGFQCKESNDARAAAYSRVLVLLRVRTMVDVYHSYSCRPKGEYRLYILIVSCISGPHISVHSGVNRRVAKLIVFLVAICEPQNYLTPFVLLYCRII